MSNLNPIQIDRYTLYLDRIVIIRFSDTDVKSYDVIFFNGDKLKLPRELKSSLNAQLPTSFLRYDEAWVNDLFLLFMDITWDDKKRSPVLLTSVEGHGIIREFGTLDALTALRDERKAASSDSEMDTAEVIEEVTEQINANFADLFNARLTS
ncbi:hypothetical protein [Rhizobium phage RHEph12]|nr:hypothetical protein [Rhizobium phage RHEph12]